MMQRNEDLDFLKGLGICFVVLGHCITSALEANNYILYCIKKSIYTFHMPLFFIVSGYIQGLRRYRFSDFKGFSVNQARKYFLPYLVWSFILYLFYFLLNSLYPKVITEQISLNPVIMLRDILLYNVKTGNVLWFVYILFLISVISCLLHNLIRNKYVNIGFLAAVLLAGFLANSALGEQAFVLKRFLVMWIYYELGVFIGKYITDINLKANLIFSLCLAVIYAVAFKYYLITGGLIASSLKVICALTGVYILYSLSQYSNTRFYRLFNYLGKKTSIIYYLHNPYFVLIPMTGLTTYVSLNYFAAIIISFFIGIILPLILGDYVVNKVNLLKFIFLGEKVWAK